MSTAVDSTVNWPGTADSAPSQGPTSGSSRQVKSQGALRRYIDSFDQQTMLQMARLVSAEGAQLVERQTCALFGNLKQLQRQMQVLPAVALLYGADRLSGRLALAAIACMPACL